MTLIHLPDDIKSEFSINDEGKAQVSVRGTSRLLNLSHSSLVESLNSSRSENPSKMAKALIEKGFEVVGFSENGIPDTAFVFICEYYAFDAGKRCTDEAKNLYRAFAAIGFRTWVQKELGWEPKQPYIVGTPYKEHLALQGTVSQLKEEMEMLTYIMSTFEDKMQEMAHIRGFIDFSYIADMAGEMESLKNNVKQLMQNSRDSQFLLQTELKNQFGLDAPPLTTRAKVNRLVRYFAMNHNVTHGGLFEMLYREFRDRFHFDAQVRSKNSGTTPLSVLEKEGKIEEFYKMSKELLAKLSPQLNKNQSKQES